MQKPVEKPNEPKPRTNYGKMALALMIVGLLLPLMSLVFNVIMSMQTIHGSTPRGVMVSGCPFLFLGFLCLLLAFIFGIIGWKTTSGKIAAIGVPCLGLLIVPGLLFLSLFSYRDVAVPAPIDAAEARTLISHKSYPMDTLEGLISRGMAVIDEDVYVNGGGSLRIKSDSAEKKVIRLYENGSIDIQNRMLVYLAKLRSEGLKGRAYLEMWCEFGGKGEFFSRGLEHPISGTTDWTTVQTPFRLEAGQSPANVKLNLVIEGAGTVWIDDIKLTSSPLD